MQIVEKTHYHYYFFPYINNRHLSSKSAFIHPSVGDILGRSEQGMQRNPLPFRAAPFSLLLIFRDGTLLKGY
jgi:hypothetical protein